MADIGEAKIHREQSKRLARTANRKVGSEAVLIWALGGVAFFFLLLFWLPAEAIDRLSLIVDPLFGLLVAATFLAGIIALVYYRYSKKVVSNAEVDFNELMKIERKKRAEEIQEKIADLKEAKDQKEV